MSSAAMSNRGILDTDDLKKKPSDKSNNNKTTETKISTNLFNDNGCSSSYILRDLRTAEDRKIDYLVRIGFSPAAARRGLSKAGGNVYDAEKQLVNGLSPAAVNTNTSQRSLLSFDSETSTISSVCLNGFHSPIIATTTRKYDRSSIITRGEHKNEVDESRDSVTITKRHVSMRSHNEKRDGSSNNRFGIRNYSYRKLKNG